MNIFVDANVLISVLNKEYPAFPFAARILSLHGKGRFQIFTSPLCLAIAYYFSEKKSGTEYANQKLKVIYENIRVSDIRDQDVASTFGNKRIHDFEDGLEYYSALRGKSNLLITENTEDFYFSQIEVLRPKDFMVRYVF
ncbi:MAG TPA: PIN domain-containing protein [Chitinophagales bacterium]|nr:PIN domain-containing protein [Chitinophagales bacterium]